MMNEKLNEMKRKMEEIWIQGMNEYYEKIKQEHVEMICEKFGIPPKVLEEELSKIKPEIMKQSCLPSKTTKSKPPKTQKKVINTGEKGKYANMTRPEIIQLCADRGLPRKRATQDMISSLLMNDASSPSCAEASTSCAEAASTSDTKASTSGAEASTTPVANTAVPDVSDNDSEDEGYSDTEITEEDYI